MQRRAAAIGSGIFFLVAPGTVAGLVPYLITDGWRDGPASWLLRVPGLILILAGVPVLIHAFVRFVTEGLGTPAPIAPAGKLVVGGLYRHVRNPMYVALVAIIVGQALWFASVGLLVYALGAWLIFALFVRFYEEPTLHRTFGDQYVEYRRNVRAWWPRIRPWMPLE